jgi:hypothetical protein
MKNQDLKVLGFVSKAVAIMVWVLVPWILGPFSHYDRDHRIFLVQNSIQALLSILPNRWLVFSRASFCVFLALALLPFHIFLPLPDLARVDIGSIVLGLLVAFVMFVPLPLSLVLSRVRFRRGEKFVYA